MSRRDWHVILNLFASSSRLQKKRAYLTIAAIAWGTVAILLLLAFGEGLKRQLDKNRRSTGENLAVMWPDVTTKPWKGLPPGRPIRLHSDDVQFVAERMPELKAVHGEITAGRTALTYGRKTVNGRVIGANFVYGEDRKHYPVAGGRFFGPEDEINRRRVAFLGDDLAKDIFGDENPDGRSRARDLGHGQELASHAKHPARHSDLSRHRRFAHAADRRCRRCEHHVCGCKGADPRDRREDGARREAAMDHHAVRPRGGAVHVHRRRAWHHDREPAGDRDQFHPD